jgi:hypothetical protein
MRGACALLWLVNWLFSRSIIATGKGGSFSYDWWWEYAHREMWWRRQRLAVAILIIRLLIYTILARPPQYRHRHMNPKGMQRSLIWLNGVEGWKKYCCCLVSHLLIIAFHIVIWVCSHYACQVVNTSYIVLYIGLLTNLPTAIEVPRRLLKECLSPSDSLCLKGEPSYVCTITLSKALA